ncbi:MAG: hypothetical protein QOG53_19 [Frankiales bacterium]|jgi:hypothetical protein|nr:hypothetical protein [Frankiales bacterium]
MTQPATPTKEHPLFKAGAILLILANILCGVFAFFAGQKWGNDHVDFAISFTFLGLVVVGIFALAFVDSATRREDRQDWEGPH